MESLPKGKGFKGKVEARVDRPFKKDIHLTIHNVKPNRHKVYVYHKDGKYHIHKKVCNISPVIAIEKHLKDHKVDFQAVINGSPDVHLPRNNWLKPGGKAILGSYELFGTSYTVKARVKRKGKKDVKLTEHHVHPGIHKVYVYHKDGNYHIAKKKI